MKKYNVTTTYKFNSTGETTSTSNVVSGLKRAKTQQQISREWVEARSTRFTFISCEITEA